MTDPVRSYGDPAAEYRAARDGAGVVDRADRAVVRVFGRDPVRMVQGLVTNDVAAAAADRSVYAALLTPKGRMLADLRILRRDDDLLLECDRGALDNVLATFRKFVPPLFARFEDVSSEHAVIGVYGTEGDDLVRRVLGETAVPAAAVEDALARFDAPGAETAHGFAMRTRYAGDAGLDVLVPRAASPHVLRLLLAAGGAPVGHAALDVLRIEAGRPRWGEELTEETIPLEAGLLERAFSTTKGCYTGQEVIVRILHRGHVNWHLRGMLLGEAPAPPKHAGIVHPDTGKRIARITSSCASPRLGQTIALGYARRELELPVEAPLEAVGGRLVTIVPLPFPVSDVGGPPDIGTAG
jgi:folate-binding protein YgfZ